MGSKYGTCRIRLVLLALSFLLAVSITQFETPVRKATENKIFILVAHLSAIRSTFVCMHPSHVCVCVLLRFRVGLHHVM